MTASFGQLVKEHRIEMGLTQQRLADLVGRSPSTVRSWERDRATPNDRSVVDAIAAVLGIDGLLLSGLAGLDGIEIADSPVVDSAPLGPPADPDAQAPPAVSDGESAQPRPRSPEPERSYLLETGRRHDHERLGPEKVAPAAVAGTGWISPGPSLDRPGPEPAAGAQTWSGMSPTSLRGTGTVREVSMGA